MSNPDRLQVDVGVDDVIGNILISAYLTDEGLVVDVFQGEEPNTKVLASGYEFFSEAGLKPPQPLEEEPRTIWDAVREEDDGC